MADLRFDATKPSATRPGRRSSSTWPCRGQRWWSLAPATSPCRWPQVGNLLDFEVIVVDDRPSFANTERFPTADRIIVDDFETAARRPARSRPSTYVVLVTRGHTHDVHALRKIIQQAGRLHRHDRQPPARVRGLQAAARRGRCPSTTCCASTRRSAWTSRPKRRARSPSASAPSS